MNNNDFAMLLKVVLEKSGVEKDYNKLKQELEKNPAKINTILDTSATKTQVNKFIKEFAPQLQKMFKDIGVNVDLKDIESSMHTVFKNIDKEAKQTSDAMIKMQKDEILAYEENAKRKEKILNDEINNNKQLYLAEEQAYKTNNSINQKKIAEINKVSNATIEAYKTNNKLNDSMEITKNRAEGANKSFSAYLKTLKPTALTQYSAKIKEVSDAFYTASQSGKSIDLSKANSQLSRFKSEMKNAGMETASFTQTLKENIGAFGQWYGIGTAISFVVRSFRNAIGNIKEVDTQLTEISKTSNLTGEALKQLGIDAYDAASKYGNTVQSYLEGYKEMSRGTNQETAQGLAEMSILAQSAGDMTSELANEYIIATNAAYKLNGEVSKINDVLDSQNQISNRNQVSMSKIAEATKVAGSQATASGVQINELTAAVGTMAVVTQKSGDEVGRAFKGILMNLQNVKGETEDGEILDDSTFTKVEKAADALGVKLKEVKDGVLSLRDPMQVLKDLSDAYSRLPKGDVAGANLISALGGKFRGNEYYKILTASYVQKCA